MHLYDDLWETVCNGFVKPRCGNWCPECFSTWDQSSALVEYFYGVDYGQKKAEAEEQHLE